jgi:hypothetical protein
VAGIPYVCDRFPKRLHAGGFCVFQADQDSAHSFVAIPLEQPDCM